MAVTHIKSTLGTTPEIIGPQPRQAGLTLAGSQGVDITIQNLSSINDIYIGGEGCTTSSYGFKIAAGAAWSVELKAGDIIWACASGAGTDYSIFMCSLEAYNG